MTTPVKLSAVREEAPALLFALERLTKQIENMARMAGADLATNKGYQDAKAVLARIEKASA